MGSLLSKIQYYFGGDVDELDDYEDYDYEEDIEFDKKQKNNRSPKEQQLQVVSAREEKPKQQVVLYKVEHFDDCTEIANSINDKITVVLNLEDSKRDTARRIIDFISGVTYANKGQLHKIANMTFIITPEAVDVDKDAFDMFIEPSDFSEK